MIRTVLLAAAAAIALPALAVAEPVALSIDPNHTSVRVEWPHTGHTPLLIAFPAFEGEVMYDAENIANSAVTFTVDTSKLWTGVPVWEEHLADPERPLLQTATYPMATFTSTAIESTGENTAKLTGDLTIKDQTHPVTFDVELTNEAPNPRDGSTVRGFLATAAVSRSMFGVDMAAEAMGDEIVITVAAELSQPAS
jgi:polyisoprenoid-binding protein YceI